MLVEVDHCRYSRDGQTLYVRLADPTHLKRATLQVAARRELGLTLPEDPRPQPESMVFDTKDYRGEHDLDRLDKQIFNSIVAAATPPVRRIEAALPFEVRALVGWEVGIGQCGRISDLLKQAGVEWAVMNTNLSSVMSLTVFDLGDRPDARVNQIGAALCLAMDDVL
jgi:hypothetical protein